MDKKELTSLINSILKGSDKFLLDLKISKNNIIDVFIDSETALTIEDCVDLSRAIEDHYDRDEEDFELRVSSPGTDKAFKDIRQLTKYIDREIEVVLPGEKPFKGVLKSVQNGLLTVETEKGKGQKKVYSEKIFDFFEADKIKPLIKFK